MKIRQSTVKDCYRAMQYNLEQPTYHGGSARAVGTAYHYALEQHYLDRMNGWNRYGVDYLVELAQDRFWRSVELAPSHPTEYEKERGNFKWNKTIPDEETAMMAIDVMVRAYFDPETGGVWPEDWEVLGVETSFELPFFGEHTRNGSIDLTLRDPNGWIVGDDQKTAGKKWPAHKESPRKNGQGPWYTHALQQLYPDAPGHRFVYSVMTYKGVFERRIADPGPEHIRANDELLANVANLYIVMKANGLDLPANPGSNLCSPEYCDWWDICPHGAVIDR